MPAQFAAVLCVACFIVGAIMGLWFGYEMAYEVANLRVRKAERLLERFANLIRSAEEEVKKEQEPPKP